MAKKNRTFTKEFKEEAVRLATEGSRSQSEVAASLDIVPSMLTKRIQAQQNEGADAFRGHGKRTAAEEELWQLRSENKRLQQELAFLKKELIITHKDLLGSCSSTK